MAAEIGRMIGILMCVIMAFVGLQLLHMAANTAIRRGQSVWKAARVEALGGLCLILAALAVLADLGGWL